MKSNFEKAKELACSRCACGYNNEERMKCGHFRPVLEMAELKDEQHKQEKQQLIDKACKLMQHWILEHDYVDIMELEDYIKKQMEE